MLKLLGVALLGTAAWLFWSNQAQAAVPGAGDIPASDPASPDVPVPAGPAGFFAIARQLNNSEFGGFFGDCSIVMGVMQTESSFRPRAYRYEPSLGEASYGLMQLLESTARDMGLSGSVDQLYDPELNIRLGMRYLKWIHDYLSSRMGSFSQLQWLSAYNRGVGNVIRGWQSQSYYSKVMAGAAPWRGVA